MSNLLEHGFATVEDTVGFSGTRSLDFNSAAHLSLILNVLAEVQKADTFVTGACKGVDAYVAKMLISIAPDAHHVIIVPSDHRQVDLRTLSYITGECARKRISLEVIDCPEGTSYRYRNTQIVDRSTRLVALPYKQLERAYCGTWMTVNIAHQLHVPVDVVTLPETS
jgi:hypothetical protein